MECRAKPYHNLGSFSIGLWWNFVSFKRRPGKKGNSKCFESFIKALSFISYQTCASYSLVVSPNATILAAQNPPVTPLQPVRISSILILPWSSRIAYLHSLHQGLNPPPTLAIATLSSLHMPGQSPQLELAPQR
jgi:hypothetical protein